MRLNILSESAYLTPEYVYQNIPSRYQPAFKKALAWEPRLPSWDWTPGESAKAVAQGFKPVGYGWSDKILAEFAAEFGLESLWDCLYLPDNADIAELVGFALGRFEIHSPIRHYIIGVCCGYPLEAVERFASQYVRPDERLAKGLQRHTDGDTIK